MIRFSFSLLFFPGKNEKKFWLITYVKKMYRVQRVKICLISKINFHDVSKPVDSEC